MNVSKPPTPLDNRVCDHCPLDLEDEIHFLIKCPKYAHISNHLFSLVQKHCKNFILLNDHSNLIGCCQTLIILLSLSFQSSKLKPSLFTVS